MLYTCWHLIAFRSYNIGKEELTVDIIMESRNSHNKPKQAEESSQEFKYLGSFMKLLEADNQVQFSEERSFLKAHMEQNQKLI